MHAHTLALCSLAPFPSDDATISVNWVCVLCKNKGLAM